MDTSGIYFNASRYDYRGQVEMANALSSQLKRLKHVIVRNGAGAHKKRRTFKNFADKFGLVYFGLVDQRSDEHRVVRGLTASSTHRDDHYTVGTFEEYDVALLSRQDLAEDPSHSLIAHDWTIIEVQLKTKKDVPHMLFEAHTPSSHLQNSLFSAITTLKPVSLGVFEEYPEDFTSRYTLYASPALSIDVQKLLPAATTRLLGAHFWPLSVEVYEKSVLIYSYQQHVSIGTLNTMLSDGLWLARHIDSMIEQI